MRYRENTNRVRELDECDRVRKAARGSSPDAKFCRDARIERIPAGTTSNRGKDSVNLGQEFAAETRTLLLVPHSGGGQLLLRLGLDPDRLDGRRSFDSISARAADQSSPPPGLDSTRRARRSISATHASSASASLGPSRLATSSSATSARSSSVRSRASPSTFWARPLTDSSVPSQGQPDQASARIFVPSLCPDSAPKDGLVWDGAGSKGSDLSKRFRGCGG
jgi:hypothetical protein